MDRASFTYAHAFQSRGNFSEVHNPNSIGQGSKERETKFSSSFTHTDTVILNQGCGMRAFLVVIMLCTSTSSNVLFPAISFGREPVATSILAGRVSRQKGPCLSASTSSLARARRLSLSRDQNAATDAILIEAGADDAAAVIK